MAFRFEWQSRTFAVRDASKWAGTAAAVGQAAVGWAAGKALRSGVLMTGLLPRGGPEALSDHLTEHPQDFPTPRRRQARPEPGQQLGWRHALGARGGTRQRQGRDMGALPAVCRGRASTTAAGPANRP